MVSGSVTFKLGLIDDVPSKANNKDVLPLPVGPEIKLVAPVSKTISPFTFKEKFLPESLSYPSAMQFQLNRDARNPIEGGWWIACSPMTGVGSDVNKTV